MPMNKQRMEQVCRGKVHHRAIIHKHSGGTQEGYLQPWDDEAVYLTSLEGDSAGKVALSDIQRIEWPDD